MNVMNPDTEILSTKARETWEDDGGSTPPESLARLAPRSPAPPTPEMLPFPRLESGKLVLEDMELVLLVNKQTLGRYRVQQAGLGERGAVFLVTLFGATCAKVEMLIGRKLEWRDYLAAMKRGIERELGYWQNRGESLPKGLDREIVVTVRDTDFAPRYLDHPVSQGHPLPDQHRRYPVSA